MDERISYDAISCLERGSTTPPNKETDEYECTDSTCSYGSCRRCCEHYGKPYTPQFGEGVELPKEEEMNKEEFLIQLGEWACDRGELVARNDPELYDLTGKAWEEHAEKIIREEVVRYLIDVPLADTIDRAVAEATKKAKCKGVE